jgi:hypothetical protein
MRIILPTDAAALGAYVPRLLAITGEARWAKRWRDLGRDFNRSPMLARIGADYHWLELLLHDLAATIAARGRLGYSLIVEDFAVLHFVAMTMEVHARLTPRGQKALEGRLRSALSAETGFAALFLEMDIARRLFDAGFDVEFPDLEATGQFDLLFSNARVCGEVECKSLSADAGRKIHRKDFYRLLEPLGKYLLRRAETGAREVFLVTLRDRLPSAMSKQQKLRDAVRQFTNCSVEQSLECEFFSLKREPLALALETARTVDQHAFYRACVASYGENVHVAGPMSDAGAALVVMRSEMPDDTSKSWLGAMEKAATQFTGSRPGFVAVQFNDLSTDELMRPHFRRRAEILTNAVCRRPEGAHVTAVFICPYRGLLEDEEGVVAPAFSLFNRSGRFAVDPADYAAFYGTMSDDEFARRIRASSD